MQAIKDVYRNYALAWETGDADLWLSLWDEGATRMPPDEPLMNKDEMRRVLPSQFLKNMVTDFVIDLEQIEVLGDFAFVRGRYTYVYTKEFDVSDGDGKFLSILKRQQDATWKFHIDCHNSNGDQAVTMGPDPWGDRVSSAIIDRDPEIATRSVSERLQVARNAPVRIAGL